MYLTQPNRKSHSTTPTGVNSCKPNNNINSTSGFGATLYSNLKSRNYRSHKNFLPKSAQNPKLYFILTGAKKNTVGLGRYHLVALDGLSELKELSLYIERAARAVLMVDLVESVRLMENDEKRTVSHWLELVHHIEGQIIPNHNGRLIKILGDGFLTDFDTVKEAIAAAFEIQKITTSQNKKFVQKEEHFLLRMGIEVADIYDDDRDIYGHGVNLAARLMKLAGPGEIVVSAATRDQLIPDIDADVEDLGDCYVKHVSEPVRAYRIGSVGPKPVIRTGVPEGELLPAIAVLPLTSRSSQSDKNVLGDVLAEELIQALSVSQHLNVISRLSTTAFRGRETDCQMIDTHLNAQFVLSGSYLVEQQNITVNVELAEVKTGKVLLADRFTDRLASVFSNDQELVIRIISNVTKTIVSQQLRRSRSRPLPTLETYSLLMAAVTLMHRLSLKDFDLAREMLGIIIERTPREAVPYAWMANWHVLKVQQGWTDNPGREGHLARDFSNRALDINPESSLALSIDGFVHTNLLKQLDIAKNRYELATSLNPSNALAWLLKGTMHAFKDEGQQAVQDTTRARVLSPVDPHKYFFDSLAATAALAAKNYQLALELSEKSLKVQRTHTSTIRAKAVALWKLGRHDEAQRTGQELLKLEPELTVTQWLNRSPSTSSNIGLEWANSLRQIGIPE